jgi:hypothetical protein
MVRPTERVGLAPADVTLLLRKSLSICGTVRPGWGGDPGRHRDPFAGVEKKFRKKMKKVLTEN